MNKEIQKPAERNGTTAESRAIMRNNAFLEHYEGIIPHPRLMREWEDIVPGSASSIFKRFERQSDHRIEIEKKVVRANNFKIISGSIFAFVISMIVIVGGIIVVLRGGAISGLIMSLAGLAPLITPFLITEMRSERKQDDPKKIM